MSELSRTILAGGQQMQSAAEGLVRVRQQKKRDQRVAFETASEAMRDVGKVFKEYGSFQEAKRAEDEMRAIDEAYLLGLTTKGPTGGLIATDPALYRQTTKVSRDYAAKRRDEWTKNAERETEFKLKKADTSYREQQTADLKTKAEERAEDEKLRAGILEEEKKLPVDPDEPSWLGIERRIWLGGGPTKTYLAAREQARREKELKGKQDDNAAKTKRLEDAQNAATEAMQILWGPPGAVLDETTGVYRKETKAEQRKRAAAVPNLEPKTFTFLVKMQDTQDMNRVREEHYQRTDQLRQEELALKQDQEEWDQKFAAAELSAEQIAKYDDRAVRAAISRSTKAQNNMEQTRKLIAAKEAMARAMERESDPAYQQELKDDRALLKGFEDVFNDAEKFLKAAQGRTAPGVDLKPGAGIRRGTQGRVELETKGESLAQFETRLSPRDEQAFQSWKAQYAPEDSGDDYDLRGAFKAGLTPGPDGHWPDTFKKPNHPTFSNESVYAKDAPESAGRWEGEKFIPGRVPYKGGRADFEVKGVDPSAKQRFDALPPEKQDLYLQKATPEQRKAVGR